MTMPMTRGESPSACMGGREAMKVAAEANMVTKRIPEKVPLRFDVENGI
jgi:hypothetical protein